MVVPNKEKVSLDEFTAFVQAPENRDKRFEFLDGEIIQVPSNSFVSVIAARIITMIGMFLLQNDIQGHLSGEGGGFVINEQIIAPDVAFVRELPTNKGFEARPPLLAVEVISDPTSNAEQSDLRRKLVHYRKADVIVWVVDYVAKQVEVHAPDEAVIIFGEDETLTVENVLPGFKLPVKTIFPQAKAG